MVPPRVVTVVLNSNRRDDTLACLDSLAQGIYENHQVIVLDNASQDGSVPAIRAAFPGVRLIELPNSGFLVSALGIDARRP